MPRLSNPLVTACRSQIAQISLGEEDIRHRGGDDYEDNKGKDESVVHPVAFALSSGITEQHLPHSCYRLEWIRRCWFIIGGH